MFVSSDNPNCGPSSTVKTTFPPYLRSRVARWLGLQLKSRRRPLASHSGCLHARMVFVPPSALDIKNTADDIVSTLIALCGDGSFFFVGSFACQLYGKHVAPYDLAMRSPNVRSLAAITSCTA